MKKIIIIGSGIIGASLAYHLAKLGADVLVIDALDEAGGVATPNSWAWINASWGNPPAYVSLRMRSMAEWRKLAKVDDQLAVNWCGGLLWDLPQDQLRTYVEDRKSAGYDVVLVEGAQASAIEPGLKAVPTLSAYAAAEGVIEPVAAARGFMRAAVALGAKCLHGQTVEEFIFNDRRIAGVRTATGLYRADETVVASGAQTAMLLAKLGITLKLDAPPGLLVHSERCETLLNGLVMAPELHVRQTAEGRLVAGSDFGGAQPGDDPQGAAEDLFSKMRGFFKGAEKLKMDFFTLGYRPTPADNLPALGRPTGVAGLYVCVTHSGITLAPAIGALCGAEIMTDVRDPLIAPFHPDRLCS